MSKELFPVAVWACLCGWTLASVPASALATRTFVAALGSDSNPCTFAAPCRSLQHAHDQTAAGGEIDVLDPAGYGAVTISKAISIQGHGIAGIAASSGDAITVNAPLSDKVSLRGLLIDGLGAANNGITFSAGGGLDVQDCLIRNFTGTGIDFEPNSTSMLTVTRTHLSSIISFGVIVQPQFSTGTLTAVLDQVEILNINLNAINFVGNNTGASATLTVADSVISNTFNNGIVADTQGDPISLMIRNSLISNIASHGVVTVGANAHVRITKTAITGNGTGIAPLGGVIDSYGDNLIDGNTTNGTPTHISQQ